MRLTERYLQATRPPAELGAAAAAIRELLPALEATSAIGVAGTVDQLSVLAGTEVLTIDAVDRLGRCLRRFRSPSAARCPASIRSGRR